MKKLLFLVVYLLFRGSSLPLSKEDRSLAYLFVRFTIYGAPLFRKKNEEELTDKKINVYGPNS